MQSIVATRHMLVCGKNRGMNPPANFILSLWDEDLTSFLWLSDCFVFAAFDPMGDSDDSYGISLPAFSASFFAASAMTFSAPGEKMPMPPR